MFIKSNSGLYCSREPLGGKAAHTRGLLMYAAGLTATNPDPLDQTSPLLCYPLV